MASGHGKRRALIVGVMLAGIAALWIHQVRSTRALEARASDERTMAVSPASVAPVRRVIHRASPRGLAHSEQRRAHVHTALPLAAMGPPWSDAIARLSIQLDEALRRCMAQQGSEPGQLVPVALSLRHEPALGNERLQRFIVDSYDVDLAADPRSGAGTPDQPCLEQLRGMTLDVPVAAEAVFDAYISEVVHLPVGPKSGEIKRAR